MNLLFVTAVLASISILEGKEFDQHSPEAVKLFEEWQVKHGKVYSTVDEKRFRYRVFLESARIINALNARPKKSGSDWAVFGLTQFADLTTAEFQKKILQTARTTHKVDIKFRKSNHTVRAPASYDWTNQPGVVTSIKDQGQVGTCWAFAGIANVESLWYLKSGQSIDLSTEALNDCDGIVDLTTSALACGPLGATMPGFYEWVIKEGGFMTWADYPYCVGTGACSPCAPEGYSEYYCGGPWPINPCYQEDSCAAKYDPSKFVSGLKVTDYVFFGSDEVSLTDDLVNNGPLVAGIDATDLQYYESGVLEPVLCNPANLNHAVLLVGYDQTSDGTQYWRIKNSWGTAWGEDGFGRIIRGQGVRGNERADQLAGLAHVSDGRAMDRVDILNVLREEGRMSEDEEDCDSTTMTRLYELQTERGIAQRERVKEDW